MDQNLEEFESTIIELKQVVRRMIEVVEDQTDAIIAGDDEKIEEQVESYSSLNTEYGELEQEFISQLEYLIPDADIEDHNLKMRELSRLYPEYADMINRWRSTLGALLKKLERKHEGLNNLLEFALRRNVDFMEELFRLNNQSSIHYGSEGDKTEISSGIALNKEA